MTVTVRNTDDHRRTWPELVTTSGCVLVLDPGAEDELPDHPGAVAHLKVRASKKATSPTDHPGGE